MHGLFSHCSLEGRIGLSAPSEGSECLWSDAGIMSAARRWRGMECRFTVKGVVGVSLLVDGFECRSSGRVGPAECRSSMDK